MAKYTLNRDHLLRTTLGQVINFKAGVPAYVPPMCEREVVAIGGERVDGNKPDLVGDEPAEPVQLTLEERAEQIREAFGLIVERNDANDFTAAGVPTVNSIQSIVDFKPDRKELNDLWTDFKAR